MLSIRTVSFEIGGEFVFDGVHINVDESGVFELGSQFVAEIKESCVEGFCDFVVNPETTNRVKIRIVMRVNRQLFWCTAQWACVVYPKLSPSV